MDIGLYEGKLVCVDYEHVKNVNGFVHGGVFYEVSFNMDSVAGIGFRLSPVSNRGISKISILTGPDYLEKRVMSAFIGGKSEVTVKLPIVLGK